MRRHVLGTEIEYGNMVVDSAMPPLWIHQSERPGRSLDGDEVTHLLRKYTPDEFRGLPCQFESGVMLRNGARLYQDMAHPEYANQETSTLQQCFAAETGGGRIVYAAFRAAQQDGAFKLFTLNKRAVDFRGNRFGTHHNYTARRRHFNIERDLRPLEPEGLGLLAMHNASATMYNGAGAIIKTNVEGSEARFVRGQKMSGAGIDFQRATFPLVPVCNLRDESHAGDEFVRIHNTCVDPQISPCAAFLQQGSTGLVIDACENPRWRENEWLQFRTGGLYRAAAAIAIDAAIHEPIIELRNGKSISAFDAQIEIYDFVDEYIQQSGGSREDFRVLEAWRHTLEGLEAGETDPAKLPTVGYLHRKQWIFEEMGWEIGEEITPRQWAEAAIKDLRYDRIGRGSPSETFQANEWAADMPPEGLITFMMHDAPVQVRSGARVRFIEHYRDRRGPTACAGWGRLYLPGVGDKVILLDDPTTSDYDVLAGSPWIA